MRYVSEKLEERGNLLRRLAPLSSPRERRRLLNTIDRRSLPSAWGEIFNAEAPREIPRESSPEGVNGRVDGSLFFGTVKNGLRDQSPRSTTSALASREGTRAVALTHRVRRRTFVARSFG